MFLGFWSFRNRVVLIHQSLALPFNNPESQSSGREKRLYCQVPYSINANCISIPLHFHRGRWFIPTCNINNAVKSMTKKKPSVPMNCQFWKLIFKSNRLLLFPFFFPTANPYPLKSQVIGGLPDPGVILGYTWQTKNHQPHVAPFQDPDLLFSPIPFTLLEELHTRFLSHYETGTKLINFFWFI